MPPNRSFAESPTQVQRIDGRSLRPLAPVHLTAVGLAAGDVGISWIRRSRSGFGWIDGADAPLAEDREAYRLRCVAGGAAFEVEVGQSAFVLSAAQQVASFGALPGSMIIEVAQMSGVVGAGSARSLVFIR